MKGDSGANLVGLLEHRLDTLVYRAKFVPTVFAARQFVNHGHVKVNGQRVNISSMRLKVGDAIEVKEKSRQLALVLKPTSSPSAKCRTTSTPTTARCGQARPHSRRHRRALSGPDGAAPGGRVLFAVSDDRLRRVSCAALMSPNSMHSVRCENTRSAAHSPRAYFFGSANS